jgi:4'-phosphopantetheinyl transferase
MRVSGTRLSVAWGTSASVPRDLGWLTADEGHVHRGLSLPKRAADWRVGRWTAKEAVRRALRDEELRGPDIEILPGEGGAPEVTIRAPGHWPAVEVSLSHSEGMGFAAAARGSVRIGCDVEAVRSRSDAFVADYFTGAEADAVRRAPADERVVRTNLLWSAKESVLKALGEGLRMDTRAVEVTLHDEPDVLWWRAFTARTMDGATLTGHWRVTGGFVWTLATDAPIEGIDGLPRG